jgi:predicted Zn-dependent peptidase
MKPRQTYLKRPVEQAYFCLGTNAPYRSSPERFAFGMLNMILGGGMSSRLFHEIREKRGLAYSIGSFAQLFKDRGCFAVSGGTSFATFEEVLRITLAEIARICAEDVTEHELAMAREQIVDHILLGMENTEARMSRIAESMLTFGRVAPVDEIVRRVREVTPAEIRAVAARYLNAESFAVSSIGPKDGYLPLRGELGIRSTGE